jgi:hypothetical protein
VGGARIEPFVQSVGALAYYTIIIQCIVVSDGGIIPSYNTAGILPQLYIRTNNIINNMMKISRLNLFSTTKYYIQI